MKTADRCNHPDLIGPMTTYPTIPIGEVMAVFRELPIGTKFRIEPEEEPATPWYTRTAPAPPGIFEKTSENRARRIDTNDLHELVDIGQARRIHPDGRQLGDSIELFYGSSLLPPGGWWKVFDFQKQPRLHLLRFLHR